MKGSRSPRIVQTRAQADGLVWGTIEWMPDARCPMPDARCPMPDAGSVPVENGYVPIQDIMSGLAFRDILISEMGISRSRDHERSLAC